MKQTLLFKSASVAGKAQQLFLSITFIFLLNILIVPNISAQDITFNVKSYKGGYNVSCNGFTDGNIDATIVGGVLPYSYNWSNGSTTQDLSNIAAGVYTLTVTDGIGSSKSKSITLFEADLIEVFFTTSVYEGGYQISKMGNNDGSITTDVKGGAPPYKYLWNTGSPKANLSKLTAGTYSVVVTDQNGCSVTKSVTLIEPTPLTLTLTATTYGSYNTSCFESKDGNINLSVSGGMPPYKYNWSNGSFEEDLSNITAGIYKVQVTDVNKATVEGQITLTQPAKLEVNLTVSNYSNGYNISCNNCFNGSITSAVTGGTSPSTYLWKGAAPADGQTTANLTNLGPGGYYVLVTDANSCKTESRAFLSEPPANAWDKNGNIADNTNFLGTTNNSPLVFKTFNVERMRITETGNIGIGTISPQSKLDVNGNVQVAGDLYTSVLKLGTPADNIEITTLSLPGGGKLMGIGTTPKPIPSCTPAYTAGNVQFNRVTINNSINLNAFDFRNEGMTAFIDFGENAISTTNPPTTLKINSFCSSNIDMCAAGGNVIMCTTPNGKVSIGTAYVPADYKLAVQGKIIAEEVNVRLFGDWPDYVFDEKYEFLTIPGLKEFTTKEKHLPNMPSAKNVEENGVNISEIVTKLLRTQEEQAKYIIQLYEQNVLLQKEIELLKK